MRTRRLLLPVAAILTALAVSGRAAPDFGKITTVQIPGWMGLETAALADFDGDGRRDLVVAVYNNSARYDRQLRIHLRKEGDACFKPEADRVLTLTPDVVAFCPGDVEDAPGKEIVLFTATGAFAWRTDSGERESPRKLLAGDFLWQLPHPRATELFSDGVRDVDGDGLDDILLPEPDGYRIGFQSRGGAGGSTFAREAFLELPEFDAAPGRESVAAARERLKELRTSLAIGGEEEGSGGDFLSVRNIVPRPEFHDFDGDGRPDLMAETSARLFVWRQSAPGRFARSPDVRLPLPLDVDTGRRLDVSFSAHALDLDGDSRADYVIVAGDRRSEDVRTQVLVYFQAGKSPGSLFGERGRPRQALFLGGFAGLLDLTDVDGDGRPDLVMGSVRVDTLDLIRAAASSDLDAEVKVYLNEGGKFSRQPRFSLEVPIPAKNVRSAGKAVTARFLGDLTRTGASDLLLRDDPERLRILAVRKTRSGLQALPRPIFEARIDRRAEVRIEEAGDGPEILVIGRREVLHVRFR